MQNDAIEHLIAKLDGHLRAFAMINSTDFDYSSNAEFITLDADNLLKSLSDHLNIKISEMRSNFDDIQFSDFIIGSIEKIEDWIGPLEEDLKLLLLPDPFKQSKVIDSEILETIRCQVSWHIMELIRILTNDFSNKQIYRVNYARQDDSKGCFYIIPINNSHLVMNFCNNNPDNG
jgi:hypothetical protein